MERTGVCFGCHQLVGDENLTDQEHLGLIKKAIEAFAEYLSKP
jgi:hypothetical protein